MEDNFKRVFAQTDDSGHWYVVPLRLKDRWDELMQQMDESDGDDDAAFTAFESEFGDYQTGGELNLVDLYIKTE